MYGIKPICSGVGHKSGFGFPVAITKRKTQSTLQEINRKVLRRETILGT